MLNKEAGWKKNALIGLGATGGALGSAFIGGGIGKKVGKRELAREFDEFNQMENRAIMNAGMKRGALAYRNALIERLNSQQTKTSSDAFIEAGFYDELEKIAGRNSFKVTGNKNSFRIQKHRTPDKIHTTLKAPNKVLKFAKSKNGKMAGIAALTGLAGTGLGLGIAAKSDSDRLNRKVSRLLEKKAGLQKDLMKGMSAGEKEEFKDDMKLLRKLRRRLERANPVQREVIPGREVQLTGMGIGGAPAIMTTSSNTRYGNIINTKGRDKAQAVLEKKSKDIAKKYNVDPDMVEASAGRGFWSMF